MDDSRYRRILAYLDDVRTEAADLLEQLPTTSLYALPLKRIQRHANSDIRLLQAGGNVSA